MADGTERAALLTETAAMIARDEAALSTTRHGMKRRNMLANRKALLAALQASEAENAALRTKVARVEAVGARLEQRAVLRHKRGLDSGGSLAGQIAIDTARSHYETANLIRAALSTEPGAPK